MYDFNSLESGAGRFRGFEAKHRTIAIPNGAVIGFDRAIEVLHLAVIDGIVQQLS
jgi:hypothetical protein